MVLSGVFSRLQNAGFTVSTNGDSRRDLEPDSGSLDGTNGSGKKTC
jgi:hypothetical protein